MTKYQTDTNPMDDYMMVLCALDTHHDHPNRLGDVLPAIYVPKLSHNCPIRTRLAMVAQTQTSKLPIRTRPMKTRKFVTTLPIRTKPAEIPQMAMNTSPIRMRPAMVVQTFMTTFPIRTRSVMVVRAFMTTFPIGVMHQLLPEYQKPNHAISNHSNFVESITVYQKAETMYFHFRMIHHPNPYRFPKHLNSTEFVSLPDPTGCS